MVKSELLNARFSELGAGWGNRTPVLSLENLYISRYTNPATTEVIIPFLPELTQAN